jgi:hypothetical protein
MKPLAVVLLIAPLAAVMVAQQQSVDRLNPGSEEGLGRVHMEITCSPNVSVEFDRALVSSPLTPSSHGHQRRARVLHGFEVNLTFSNEIHIVVTPHT